MAKVFKLKKQLNTNDFEVTTDMILVLIDKETGKIPKNTRMEIKKIKPNLIHKKGRLVPNWKKVLYSKPLISKKCYEKILEINKGDKKRLMKERNIKHNRKFIHDFDKSIAEKPHVSFMYRIGNIGNVHITDIIISPNNDTRVKFTYKGNTCEACCYGDYLGNHFWHTDLTVNGVTKNIDKLHVPTEIRNIPRKTITVIKLKK